MVQVKYQCESDLTVELEIDFLMTVPFLVWRDLE